MSSLISTAQAQATGAAPAGGGLSQILILVVFVVVFYFLLIRPQQKRAKEHQALLAKLTAGDEVVTSGGIVGKVMSVKDAFVTIEIASNTEVVVQKHAITTLLPKGTLKSL